MEQVLTILKNPALITYDPLMCTSCVRYFNKKYH